MSKFLSAVDWRLPNVTRKFTVLLGPAKELGFIVLCLTLPVASQLETKEEALANIKEAAEGYLEVKANSRF